MNIDIWHCPTDPTAVDIRAAALANFHLPLCEVGSVPGRDTGHFSYMVNQAVITIGKPNPLFFFGGAYLGAPVVQLAAIEYPAETAIIYDARLSGVAAGCSFDSLLDARHRAMSNATWADGHAKVVKTQPAAQVCPSADGKMMLREYAVTDAGPYQGRTTLTGIPFKNADGSWGLR